MSATAPTSNDNVVSLRRDRAVPRATESAAVVTLESIGDDGRLSVKDATGRVFLSDWLETEGAATIDLSAGDRLLIVFPSGGEDAVVVGRIGRYRQPAPAKQLCLESTETLSLRCGESSLELRADGKVSMRGMDVLVRARRTQRIKAGTVNIN